MAGFADLVLLAQPALLKVRGEATVGRTWRFEFEGVVDEDDAPVDLSAVTLTALVVDAKTSATVLALTATGTLGGFTLSATQSATSAVPPGRYEWSLVATSGSESIQVWGSDASPFTVRAA